MWVVDDFSGAVYVSDQRQQAPSRCQGGGSGNGSKDATRSHDDVIHARNTRSRVEKMVSSSI